MKKLLLFLSIFGLAFSLAACGDGDDNETPTCETGQVYNEDTEACEDEVPTCTGDQVLNEETNTCEDPVVVVTLAFSGVADATVEKDDVFNVLDGVTLTGSDNQDYSTGISVTTPDCYIDSNNVLDTSTPRTCIVEYSGVGAGAFVREQITVTITQPTMSYPDDFGPDLMTWDFEEEADLDGFAIYTAGGGAIDMSIESGAMKLVTVSGGQRYETRLDYMGLQLEEGEYYWWQFDAKSDIDGKKIHLNFGQLLSNDPWFAPFKVEGQDFITLTTDWETYSIYFTAEDVSSILGDLVGGPLFEMGNIEGSTGLDATIWIDNMIIAGGSGVDAFAPTLTGVEDKVIYIEDMETFDPLAGVAAMDNVDGDITANITLSGHTVDPAVAGAYLVIYTIYDAANNKTEVTRLVTVMNDTVGAELSGIEDVIAFTGTDFTVLDGVMAMDGRDGDLTASIVVTGDVFDLAVEGDYTITYTVTDAAGNVSTVDRVVTVLDVTFIDAENLTNGSFDVGPWYNYFEDWHGDNSADAFFFTNENGLNIEIDAVGNDFWHVLIEQEGIVLEANKTYHLTFDASSTVARDIQVEIAGATGITVGGDEFQHTVALTDAVTTFTVEIVVGDTGTGGTIKFLMGKINDAAASTIVIDNVMLEEYDGAAIVADTDQILDGSFDEWKSTGWAPWSPDGSTRYQSRWNEGYLYYGAANANPWENKLEQTGIDMIAGLTYRVTFNAKGDAARDFIVGFWDGGTAFEKQFELGTDFQTYTWIFEYTGGPVAGLEFKLGQSSDNFEGTVFIVDSVMIEVEDAEPVIPDPVWNGYGTDTVLTDNMDGTFTYAYNLTTEWWWDWSAQYEYGVYDGATFNNADLTFTGVTGTEYKFKIEVPGGPVAEVALVADGTEQVISIPLTGWTEEQRSNISKLVVFAVGNGTVTPVVGSVTFSVDLNTIVIPDPVWNGYGMTVVDNAGVATITYDVTGDWWTINAQHEYLVFDGTYDSITFTFTGTVGHEYLFKIENAGAVNFVEQQIAADGTEQTLTLDLSGLSQEVRSSLSKIIVFCVVSDAPGTVDVEFAPTMMP